MVKYLTDRALDNPTAFMGLLGKVLPMQLANDDSGEPFKVVTRIELVAPDNDDT